MSLVSSSWKSAFFSAIGAAALIGATFAMSTPAEAQRRGAGVHAGARVHTGAIRGGGAAFRGRAIAGHRFAGRGYAGCGFARPYYGGRYAYGGRYYRRGINPAVPILGAFGALLGAATYNYGYGYGYPYGYSYAYPAYGYGYPYGASYYPAAYGYGGCQLQRVRVWTPYGWRRVWQRVCY